MNKACKKQGKFKENQNKKVIYTQNPNEAAEMSATHNVK